MYRFSMTLLRRFWLLVAAAFCVAFLASCGSADGAEAVATASESQAVSADADEDHDDHGGDKDHGDEDHDEHGDEDHDEHDEHGDEDHDEHGDEDHDDHGDEDHDEHGDEDHGDEDVSGGFDSHVHGAAELFVGVSGGDVVIDFESPAINIVGFEYEPETEDDKATVDDRTQALASPDMLVINPKAECELVSAPSASFVVDGTHAEVTASWLFSCANPDEISQLDATGLFQEFDGLEDVDAQWASDSQQSAAELTPSSTILAFE